MLDGACICLPHRESGPGQSSFCSLSECIFWICAVNFNFGTMIICCKLLNAIS